VLKWIDDDWNFSVETRIGILSCVRDDDEKDWHAKWIFDDIDDSIGYFDTAAAAMDACEADYIERCSEFLRVAWPGECVVKVKDLKVVLDDYRAADLFDGDVADRLTAAIDAATGERK
jgi:hypothetical protein